MTIELYFSNQLDQLAEKFSDVVAQEVRGKDNILQPPVVIVPNSNLAKWLQLFLAEKNSIFMNIEFEYLEAGLWGMLAALDSGENKPDMMDSDQLKILLLHLLQNLDRSDAGFFRLHNTFTGKSTLTGRMTRPDSGSFLKRSLIYSRSTSFTERTWFESGRPQLQKQTAWNIANKGYMPG